MRKGLDDQERAKRAAETTLLLDRFRKLYLDDLQTDVLFTEVNPELRIVTEYNSILQNGFRKLVKPGNFVNEVKIAAGMEFATLIASPIKHNNPKIKAEINALLAFHIGINSALCTRLNDVETVLSSLDKPVFDTLNYCFQQHLTMLLYLPKNNKNRLPYLSNSYWWDTIYNVIQINKSPD